jgi:hypothetical protein
MKSGPYRTSPSQQSHPLTHEFIVPSAIAEWTIRQGMELIGPELPVADLIMMNPAELQLSNPDGRYFALPPSYCFCFSMTSEE